LPKPLLPIGNRPVLAHTLGQLEAAGVTEALLVIGHQAHLITRTLGGRCGGVALRYVVQSDPKGTGQAAALAEEFAAGEPIFLMFGDIVTSRQHVPDILRIHAEERPAAVLSVRYFRDPASGGAVYVEDGRVVRIVEKPKPGETTTHYINAGLFVFPPAIFDLLRKVEPSPRGEYELTDAIRMLIQAGQTVRAYDLKGFWVNVTDPATYLEAQRELFAEGGCPSSRVPSGVEVRGLVAVGAECRVAPCQLGPDVSLGETCTVGQGAALRDAIVMAGAAIGAGARVESAVVGLGARVRDGVQLVGDPEKRAAVVLHGDFA
jgi:NDP-sugar pyrophosphorylase family protein